jgi:hypothetical protein
MRIFSTILILFITLSNSFAQVNFNAVLNKNTVKVGERFTVEFKANTNFTQYTPPAFSHFNVLSGPNQSSSMSWVNGKQSVSKAFTYYLTASSEGTFVIGEAKIEANGKAYTSKPVQIKVVKAAQQKTTSKKQASNNKTIANADENLFLKAYINKTKGVVGDQFIATYKLYTRLDISGIVNQKLPDNGGFWKEDINLPERTVFTQENINGLVYNTAVIKQTVLFPQKSGKIKVEPLEVTFRVRTKEQGGGNRRSVFDQFFGRHVEKDMVVKSNSLNINIDAVPQKGKPSDYSGGVGRFTFSAKPDKTEMNSNDAFNFNISIKGSGNIQLLQAPKVDFPADFETYDPKTTDKNSATANGVSGRKTYNYLVIPRHSGDFVIPEIRFSYYDTKSKRYKTITQGPFNIHVNKGENEDNNTTVFSGQNKKELKVIGTDIRYIHTNTTLNTNNKYFLNSLPYFLILGFPFILLSLLFVARKKIDKSKLDIIGNKKKKATKLATKKLAIAKKHLDNNELDTFYEEVTNAIYGYFGDKFNIDKAAISREVIIEKLNNLSIDSSKTESLVNIIEKCEMARFAPIKDISGEGMYEEVLSIISTIEEQAK